MHRTEHDRGGGGRGGERAVNGAGSKSGWSKTEGMAVSHYGSFHTFFDTDLHGRLNVLWGVMGRYH